MRNNIDFKLLKISTFLVFIGRGYQHLFWDAPFRVLLWDQNWLEGIVNLLGINWEEYVSSSFVDYNIQLSIKLTGLFYVVVAFCCLFYNLKNKNILKWPIVIGGFGLIILALLFCKEKFYHIGQFFEYSIQFGLPFVLIYYLNKKFNYKIFLNTLKILIAFTFVSHGMYALGYYTTPGLFIDMMISALGVNETIATNHLIAAGILDILLVPFLFIKKTEKIALLYAFLWGILTALARLFANYSADFPIESLNQFLFEAVIRLPHGLVPLLTFMLVKRKSENIGFREVNQGR